MKEIGSHVKSNWLILIFIKPPLSNELSSPLKSCKQLINREIAALHSHFVIVINYFASTPDTLQTTKCDRNVVENSSC